VPVSTRCFKLKLPYIKWLLSNDENVWNGLTNNFYKKNIGKCPGGSRLEERTVWGRLYLWIMSSKTPRSACVHPQIYRIFFCWWRPIISASVVWPVKVDGNETFAVLNNNTIYCRIISANHTKSTKFITFLWKHLHGDWSQITATRTNTKPTAWLPPNAESARHHHRRHYSLVCIFCYQSRHCQNLISMFSASHERRTRTVKRDGQWLLYLE
jgi:hypothetical protein